MIYPAMRYRRDDSAELGYESKIVRSPEDEAELGSGWAQSPASFGIETAPGEKADPAIAANVEPAKKSKK